MAKITYDQYVTDLETALSLLEIGYAERKNGLTGKWLVEEGGLYRFATKIESRFLDAAEKHLKSKSKQKKGGQKNNRQRNTCRNRFDIMQIA